VADPVEARPCRTCVTVPNFMALGQTFWAYVGPKNFLVDAGCPAPLGRERDEPLETRDYAMCVTKFRRCRSNRLNVGGKFQKTGDAGALTP